MNTMINTDTTIHLTIDSTTTENDFEMVYNQMKEINTKKGFFNLLLEVEDASSIKNIKSIGFISEIKWFAVKNMRKYAVVTDVDWLENIIPVGNLFTPGIPMKSFDEDDIQEAIDWINTSTENEKHGMAMLRFEDYLHLLVFDTLTKADYMFLKKEMSHFDDKVSLLVEMGDYEGLTLQAFWEDLKMGFSSYGKIKNIALVSDKNINTLVKTADFVTPGLDLKLFSKSEMHDAIEWLKKQ